MGFSELVNQQEETGTEIQRLINNYKKDGSARKTLDYLQKRLLAIENQWDKFEQTHLKILTDHGDQLNHAYFTNEYYKTICNKYEDINADIQLKIEDLRQGQNVTSNDDLLNLKSPLLPSYSSRQQNANRPLNNTNGSNATASNASALTTSNKTNAQLIQMIQKRNIITTTIQSTLRRMLNDQTPHSEQFYSIKIKTIQQHWESAQKLHQKIWDSIDESTSNLYDINNHFQQEEQIEYALIKLSERASTISATQASRSEITTSSGVRLPKVALPKFDGDYSKWRPFRDLFSELVHNQQIPLCQKMWYLKTSVTGEAEKLIRHFTISDANYTTAWSTIKARLNLVQKFKHCVHCLKSGHRPTNCPSRSCTVCQGKHNTLLHLQSAERKETVSTSTNHTAQGNDSFSLANQGSTLTSSTKSQMVVLATAMVNVIDNWGSPIACRAILDSGSQLNFVTEELVQKLGLRREQDTLHIEGIGQQHQRAQQRVNLKIQSQTSGFSTRIEAHILSKIISPQPPQEINVSKWKLPRNIVLADINFHQPGTIDLLIGAETFYSILAVGQIEISRDLPILQNTLFGWTVSGRISNTQENKTSTICGICTKDELLNQHIERFWQLEEVNEQPNNHTSAERRCENHFEQTTSRNSDGRLVVRLPFCEDPQALGESKDIAYQRFKAIERKLAKDNELRTQYINFMKEYLTLGHMEEVCFNNIQQPYYFLPHHCVIKPDSSTMKLRVVFDGSAKTSTNVSLNDIISRGPTIQDDVFTILLRFRLPRFVFTADIEKMYRQVLIHPTDRKYQLIWWRDDPTQPVKCFQLTTVTYGTTSAPYLAQYPQTSR